jgi:hypothetical protein
MEEQSHRFCERYGESYARRWYCAEVVKSMLRLVGPWLTRIAGLTKLLQGPLS